MNDALLKATLVANNNPINCAPVSHLNEDPGSILEEE